MIAFPANPEVNDTYTASGRTWRWNGTVWQLQPRTLTSADITDFAEAVGNTAPPTTDAALLTSGTLPDARLSAAVTASLALADTASQPGHDHTIAEVTGLDDALDAKQASGNYAVLVNGTVPSDQLPSYVDDVLEFADLAAFPEVGETGKIYAAIDTRKIYRWSGSVYIEISPSEVTSVAGKTGAVTLAKGDVGLGNVANTAPADLPISTATQAALDTKVTAYLQGGDTPVPDLAPAALELRDLGVTGETALKLNSDVYNGANPNSPNPWEVRIPDQFREAIGAALADPDSEPGVALRATQLYDPAEGRIALKIQDTVVTFDGVEYAIAQTASENFRAALSAQIATIFSDTAPAHSPGLEWVDTTDLRSYRSYQDLWIEIDRA
jgi:hypothetical protein